MTSAAPAVRKNLRPHRWTMWLAIPLVVCLIVYWRGFNTWFLMDDFAWLGLRSEVHSFNDLVNVLFRPQAQGTVRVFSERVFFLLSTSLFGYEALPLKIGIFLTQFANLILLGLLTRRLTDSRVAAVAAPLIWCVNSALMIPLSWTSAYNQILWVFCLLSGTLAFIQYADTGRRRWLGICWLVYLMGFGVLELNVVFPGILLLYVLCGARDRWKAALPFFVPAALFTYVHFALIPKSSDPVYRMYFDADLFEGLWKYVAWGFGPSELGSLVDERWRFAGYAITALAGLMVVAFSAIRMRRRDWLPVFLLGWFVLTIAPVLPLKTHRVEYYLTAPTIGFAILAAWAFASAWKTRRSLGALAAFIVAAYAAGMYAQMHEALSWRYDNSIRMRDLLFAVEDLHARDPKPVLLLSGVDHRLYSAGFNDHPFRLFAPVNVYLAPGSEVDLKQERHGLRGVDEYVISENDAARVLNRNEAVVLHLESGRIRNVTARYAAIARARSVSAEQRRIDVGLPGSEEKLGPTWYPIERGFRWMPESATVRLAGPGKPGSKLRIEGFTPAAAVAGGPVQLRVASGGLTLDSVQLEASNKRFSHTILLPPEFVGKPAIVVEVSVNRTFQSPDSRRLGLIFGTFEILSP